MKIVLISGSHRVESQSERVGRFCANVLSEMGVSTYFFSLAANPLPLWDEGVFSGESRWREIWGPITQELQSADGFVIISPEWSGMVPAGLKNFFLLCNQNELAHKPATIIAVSSGLGGSYVVAELRESSYKNTRICYIPDHVIVRNVEQMLLGETATNAHDHNLRQRISYSLSMLLEYARALKSVRENGKINFKEYPFGM